MVDLHTHSTVSDGSEPPAAVVAAAAAAGCRAVALTDHDSLAGLDEAARAAEAAGVELVRGCEVSCRAELPGLGARSMHVLVYFVAGDGGPLHDELARLRDDRVVRNRRLLDRLAELGVTLDRDRLLADAGGEAGLGRPHVARALVAAGAAEDLGDAFDRFLAEGRPAYVPKARLAPQRLAGLARQAGAAAVVAHPLALGLEPAGLEAVCRELAGAGFCGLEAVYGGYRPDDRARLRRLADRVGLVATGGSDFHGSFTPGCRVGTGYGDLEVPDRALDDLAARAA